MRSRLFFVNTNKPKDIRNEIPFVDHTADRIYTANRL